MGRSKPPIRQAETDWHDAFLKALRETPVVSYAARLAKQSRSNVYEHREKYPVFAAQWDDALAEGMEMLEVEALKRARMVSDTLMIFLLKAYNPAKFRDQIKVQSTNLNIDWENVASELTDDELSLIAAGENPATVLAKKK